MSRATVLLAMMAMIAPAASLASCGARTGLPAPPPEDAPEEAEVDAEASVDTAVDTFVEDTTPAPIDVLRPEVHPICDDPSVQFVYAVTESNELVSFFPPTGAFRAVGRIACPARGGATPFSMAVDRKGVAYVVFNDGELFKVQVKDASCAKSTFTNTDPSFKTFGMAFAAEPGGGETLYVASAGAAAKLGRIRLPEVALESIAPLDPPALRAELSGTGAGQLFGFWALELMMGSAVGAIDKTTAKILERSDLHTVEQGNGWAFAFWGGDFYLFTASSGSGSSVTRFRPSDRSVTKDVATYPAIIVGAGVSTCAPL